MVHPRSTMRCRWRWLGPIVCGFLSPELPAEIPRLLTQALQQWTAGHKDLAFTQQTRIFLAAGGLKEERVERYDPSLPDSSRWRLIEVDGRPATAEERTKWETWKNGKPRKKAFKSPTEYLDLNHATLVDETLKQARFEIGLRPEAVRLLETKNLAVLVTIDKEGGGIAGIAATLRQPIRVLLGLARITNLDLDFRIEPGDEDPARKTGAVQSGSTARVTMSKLGQPMEYRWSEFSRVATYRGP